MEENLNKILDEELAKLKVEKQQLDKEISQLSGRIEKNEDGKYDMTKEEKEYRKELENIEKEIINLEKTKKISAKLHSDRNNIQAEQDSLLKDKEQLEVVIKELEGKYVLENGKLVKPKELLGYENSLKVVSEKILKNERKLKRLNDDISKLYEKYKVKENDNKSTKENAREVSEEQKEAWKGTPLDSNELLKDMEYAEPEEEPKETPLNTDELFREAREDGDLPPRDINVVPIDDRKFSKEQEEAWKGTPLDNNELFKEKEEKIRSEKKQDIAKIIFDITKGEYKYFNGDVKKKLSIMNKDGLEVLNKEDKQKIIQDLIKKGVDPKKAKKVDPYIYALLGNLNPDLQSKYMAAVDNPVRGVDGLEIEYNLKTRENNKKRPQTVKLPFLQKLKIGRVAGYHQKNKLAKVLRDKSKAKLYAVLATLGIGAGAGAVKLIGNSQNDAEQPTQITYSNGLTTYPVQPSVTPSATPTPTPTQKPKEEDIDISFEDPENDSQLVDMVKNTENDSQLVDMVKNTESQIGKKVTIELGSHVYADPTDAIKETLGKATQNNVYEKTKNADKLYSVTREGIYCPDGTYVATPDKDGEKDLKTAMQKKGIDPKILDNIDTEELKQQGYKYMLHVEAKGISEWVEKGNTSEIQVDKFGNRITKLPSEQNKETISSDTKTKEESQLSR